MEKTTADSYEEQSGTEGYVIGYVLKRELTELLTRLKNLRSEILSFRTNEEIAQDLAKSKAKERNKLYIEQGKKISYEIRYPLQELEKAISDLEILIST